MASLIILITGTFKRNPANIVERILSLCTITTLGLNFLIALKMGITLKYWLILKNLISEFIFFKGDFNNGLICFAEKFFLSIPFALVARTDTSSPGFFINSFIMAKLLLKAPPILVESKF